MTRRGARLLVAGVGNIFLADDAFGPEVVRGLDLAYELLDGYVTAVLVDAAERGHPPGTLSLIEPELPDRARAAAAPEAHGMDPAKVLALAAHLGDGPLPRVLVLACEPQVRPRADEDIAPGLSAPVGDAVDRAVEALHAMVPVLLADPAATPPLSRPEESADPSAAGLASPVTRGVEGR
ncbi:hydrogenase maturation protease [Streptomyces regalis]|uniref:Hydrogenase n=1 Tax=Streptomyces regalis TaxID=68262 RepID=A0A101JCL1_9ACTN|nr:hydrogenase maturation protease [Streptomyces regalis]KUL24299.1 hydrogenase [Streptomyces regalis]